MLEFKDVTKCFSVRTGLASHYELIAVDKVSFTINEGETVGLVGESGCGKSTVGRCILRLVDIDSGTIRFVGEHIHNLPERKFRGFRKDIQMVFQNPLASFNPLFTIQQSLLDPLQLRTDLSSAEREDTVINLLEMVNLPADFTNKRPHELSGGQLQRIALARALASNPRFVFLDEPTSSLDISIRGQIVNLLLDLQDSFKNSYLFVTHDLRVIHFVADRVLVMYLGQIVETGTRDMIFSRPLHPYTHGLLAATMIGREARQQARYISRLKGEVVALPKEITGCKLYNRCGYAVERCEEPQELVEARPGHWVRCWRANELQLETKAVFGTDLLDVK